MLQGGKAVMKKLAAWSMLLLLAVASSRGVLATPGTHSSSAPMPNMAAASHGGHMNAVAPVTVFDQQEALARSRSSLGNRIGNYRFVDEVGRPVLLHDFLGKPLLINLIYTSCFHICPTTTRHLFDVVEKSRGVLGGQSFNVVTIGFDAERDSPAMMAQFAAQQGVSTEGWHFLSGDAGSITGIARDLGYTFQRSPSGFDHVIQTSIVAPDGTLYRQVYGMAFQPPLVIEPLKHLLFGDDEENLATFVTDRIRLFCTVYDPSREGYRIDYSIFIGTVIAFLCVGLFGWQLAREWRTHLRYTREGARTVPPS